MTVAEQIASAKREALRIALVLENPFSASGIAATLTCATTVIYRYGGRTFHLVVHDMGEAAKEQTP